MPKQFLLPSGWIDRPCLFHLPFPASSSCAACEEQFTFWSRRRHCEFCGYVVHRVGCSRKCTVNGEFFRRRICSRCDYYRHRASRTMRQGSEFISYCRGREEKVTIGLIEETGELQFQWTSQGMLETLDLRCIEAQKGFSHGGRMKAVDYDPLRSMSVMLIDDTTVRVVDLKAPSAWLCQLWVEGIAAAKYVHYRVAEQEEALKKSQDKGARLTENNWFRTNYLPRGKSSRSSHGQSSPLCFRPVGSRKRKLDETTHCVDDDFEELQWPYEGTGRRREQDHKLSGSSDPSSTLSLTSESTVTNSGTSSLSLSKSDKQHCSLVYSSSPKSRKTIAIPQQAGLPSTSSSSSFTTISQPSPSPSPKSRKTTPTSDKTLTTVATSPRVTSQRHPRMPPRSHSIKITRQTRNKSMSPQSSAEVEGETLTPGLPYCQSPLASICSCHKYELTIPRSYLVVDDASESFSQASGSVSVKDRVSVSGRARGLNCSQCCSQCEIACKVALDLSNL